MADTLLKSAGASYFVSAKALAAVAFTPEDIDLGDYAFVETADGHAILFKEGHSVVTVFAAHEQLQEGLTKTLKAVTAKAAKFRKGELVSFKASE